MLTARFVRRARRIEVMRSVELEFGASVSMAAQPGETVNLYSPAVEASLWDRRGPASRPVSVLAPKLWPASVKQRRANTLGASRRSSIAAHIAAKPRTAKARPRELSLITTIRTVWSSARVAHTSRCRIPAGETVSSRDPAGAASANIRSPKYSG